MATMKLGTTGPFSTPFAFRHGFGVWDGASIRKKHKEIWDAATQMLRSFDSTFHFTSIGFNSALSGAPKKKKLKTGVAPAADRTSATEVARAAARDHSLLLPSASDGLAKAVGAVPIEPLASLPLPDRDQRFVYVGPLPSTDPAPLLRVFKPLDPESPISVTMIHKWASGAFLGVASIECCPSVGSAISRF